MRKTKLVTIEREGRDKGKTFRITEKSAWDQEWFATRVFLGMAGAGIDVPDEVTEAGMAGLASFGFRAIGSLSPEVAKPLLDEMMECVAFVPDPAKSDQTRKLMDEDIEEVSTLLQLKKAIWDLHTGFFSGADSQTSAQ